MAKEPKADPLRVALAEAVSRRVGLIAEIERSKRAERDADELVWQAMAHADAAAATHGEAVANAGRSMADILLRGEAALIDIVDAPRPHEATRAECDAATDRVNRLRAARDTLEPRRRELESDLRYAEDSVDKAIVALVKASPIVLKLVADYRAAKRIVRDIEPVLGLFSASVATNMLPDEIGSWRPEPMGLTLRPAWDAALLALRSDAAAALPT